MQVCDRPEPTSKNTPDMAQLNDNKAYEPSLNFEPGCIKVVDTFRRGLPLRRSRCWP